MLDALKFVRGAVSTKDFVPALTHFHIHGGRVTGYNGKLSLSAPIPLDVDCCPKAIPFVKAIEACEETAQMHLTPSNKLAIRSGKFKANIDTLLDEVYPEVVPEGLAVETDGGLLHALTTLYDFSAEDASRPWAAGVLLDGNTATATNNVVIVQKWLGYHFPYRTNLPRYAVKEMLRIGEEPVGMMLSDKNATFFYEGDRWLRTQLNSLEWPNVDALLDSLQGAAGCPVPAGLFEALETLAPFVDEQNRVYILDNMARTGEDSASVEVPGLPGDSIFNLKMLRLLGRVATDINFAAYPDPVPFVGDKLRGAIAGMTK